MQIPYDMLSDYCKKIDNEYGLKVDDMMKLVPNLGDKTKHVLHYKNIQLHFSLLMKLKKNS